VFLHPQTHEEYALARLERKTAPGYRGFVAEFSPAVTLEQDLLRRDLTVNAMARSEAGVLVDPYGGAADLERRVLKHVSPAFAEDPVRVLRVARFIARFAPLGFTVAPETLALMRGMVANGEINALVPERVWREMAKALESERPDAFFATLAECGALPVLLPELTGPLDGAPLETAALESVHNAARLGFAAPVRFAALCAGVPPLPIAALCDRLRVPNEFRELAMLTARFALVTTVHGVLEGIASEAARALDLLMTADAFRRPERFDAWLQVLRARASASELPSVTAGAAKLVEALRRAAAVQLDGAQLAALKGPAIAEKLRSERLRALASTTIGH
jgi:tRNA nucleotidyltransferase (CCA-adding enzyme)